MTLTTSDGPVHAVMQSAKDSTMAAPAARGPASPSDLNVAGTGTGESLTPATPASVEGDVPSDRDVVRTLLLNQSQDSPDGCRLWLGEVSNSGYGKLWFNGAKALAHRAAWYTKHGQWPPPWIFVLHCCDTPLCIQVTHLFTGSHQDNVNDAARKGRLGRSRIGACPNGHSYDEDSPPTTTRRYRCVTCKRAAEQRRNLVRRGGLT